ADRMNNRERIMGYLETHPNSEWEYVIANGDLGQKPTTASFFYPWAGHLISRSGFDKNAHWSFFYIVPWGSGHQHNDKLHLSIAAFGQDYLVDAGRFAYRGEVADKFRGYACGSQGHNVILFNDKGQDPGPKLAETPLGEDHFLLTANYDYAWGEMSDFMHEKAAHEHVRSMLYVHNKFWVVVDKVHSQHPSEKQILWHWHPKCEVKVIGREVTGLRNNGILRIIPADQNNYQIEVVRGQEGPEIQGWYSPVYNVYEPNVATIFHSPESKDAVFVWLLVPSEGSQKQITARIVGQTEDLVELEILGGDLGNYHLKVPYQNSQMVTFESH
ncbi:MAG: heparinase II/III-family protein, partial [Saprospiraceae bacterium]|nr:heparinase II/III-family protein [Saprospiraceae bacterium]